MSTPSQQGRNAAPRPVGKWLALAALALALVGGGVALTFALTGSETDGETGGEGQDLAVRVRDTRGDCDEYTRSNIVGARVTVSDADGSIVGTGQARGDGEPFQGGCAWEVDFGDVPESVAYTVSVELPRGQYANTAPPLQELTFSRDELAASGWVADLGKNF